MGTIHEYGQTYTFPDESPGVLAIWAAIRGTIRRFRVIAIPDDDANDPVGTPSLALYNAAAAFVLDEDDAITPVLAPDAELYRVTPDIGLAEPDAPVEYAYSNKDNGVTTRVFRLYLYATGLAGTKIGISLAIEDPSHL